MEKFKKLFKEHKWPVIIGGIVILFFLILLIGGYFLFFTGKSSVYGDRLEGIKEIAITDSHLEEAKNKIKENDKVNDANIHVKGKIVSILIDYKEDTTIDQAKEIAALTLESFSDEEKAFYDFEYFLTQKSVEDSETFPVTGTKHHKLDSISYIKS